MKISLVHLSDIHLKEGNNYIQDKMTAIAQSLFMSLNSVDIMFIVISGDIANSGSEKEYKVAKVLLDELISILKKENDIPIEIVIAPGNHDCNFEHDTSIRKAVLKTITSEEEPSIDKDIIDQCVIVQKDYFDFRNAVSANGLIDDYKLWSQYSFEIDKKIITFDCINSSWTSNLHEKQGKLIFPAGLYDKKDHTDEEIRIIVLHHPLAWLKQGQYQKLRTKLRALGDLILTGHEHNTGATAMDDAFSGDSVFIEGSVLQSNSGDNDSGFNVIEIDIDDGKYKYTPLKYVENGYIEVDTVASWSSYKRLPERLLNEFRICDENNAWLKDPGANYSHPAKENIELSDFFVYPDLEEIGDFDIDRNYFSASIFLDESRFNDGILIKGKEKSGKTSLLKTLYVEYHNQGLVPVFISGYLFARTADKDLSSLIDSAIKEQYCEKAISEWKNISKERKVIFLDDLDRTKVPDKYKWKILNYLKKHFGKIIITADDMMDVNEIISKELTEEFSEFKHYEIQNFGYKLRHDLINKWNLIGDEQTSRIDTLLERVDSAEKIVNTVVGKNLVPRVPIYLLTLLQSLESTNPADIQNSAFGYYHQYLITESLAKVGVSVGEFNEFFNYCSMLAWFYYGEKSKEVLYSDIVKFTNVYSEEYTYVDCSKRLDKLCSARLLTRRGDYYSFSYPYVYYFFLGKYIAENIQADQEIQNIIQRCSAHAYVRNNSNILHFTIHHAQKTPYIIESVLNELKKTFEDQKPLSFDGDTTLYNELVDDTMSLTYTGSDPHKNRRKSNELQDKLETLEGDDEIQEYTQELDLPAKLNKLFKTIEILGQILKSYYGSIKNTEKSEIINEIYLGPLRAAREFLVVLDEHKDSLISDINDLIKSKDKDMDKNSREALAKKFVFDFIGMITYSFIYRAAYATSSEHLNKISSDVANANGTLAFKLISLASKLDLPGSIPFNDIESLANETKKDIFAHRLLSTIVLRHLYFFKVSEIDKQKICSYLGISMKAQREIDLKRKGKKINK